MAANERKSYFGYLNNLVNEYDNNYHCPVDKKPVDADYSVLTEEIEWSHKSPKFKVVDRVRITKYKKFLAKITHKTGQEKYFLLIMC